MVGRRARGLSPPRLERRAELRRPIATAECPWGAPAAPAASLAPAVLQVMVGRRARGLSPPRLERRAELRRPIATVAGRAAPEPPLPASSQAHAYTAEAESKGVLLAMCDQRPLTTARGGGHWALAAAAAMEERRARALAQPSPPLVAGRTFLPAAGVDGEGRALRGRGVTAGVWCGG